MRDGHRFSVRTGTVALLAVVLFAAVGTAVPRDISASGVPDEAEVGTDVTSTVTIEDAYSERSRYTLRLATELENVTWVVEEFDQGDRVARWTGTGRTFRQQVSSRPSGTELRIEVRGDVPAIEDPSYSPRQAFTVVALSSGADGSVRPLKTYEAHHYTNESLIARRVLDEARRTVETGGERSAAEDRLKRAVSAYNRGNFRNAIAFAEDSRELALADATTTDSATTEGTTENDDGDDEDDEEDDTTTGSGDGLLGSVAVVACGLGAGWLRRRGRV